MQMNAAALWINNTFADFDLNVTLLISKLAQIGNGAMTPFMEFISLLCKYGIALILLGFALMLFRKTRRSAVALFAGITFGLLLTNCCVKLLVARPRPYTDETSIYYQLWLLVGQSTESDRSFPSGHATAAFAAMMGLFLTSRRKYISWTLFIFSVLEGISRVYLVVHYPTDVIAGMIVGLISGTLGYLFMLKIPDSFYNSRKPYALNGGAPAEPSGERPRSRQKGGKHCR